ncbi:MAG: lysophospholipid acyltransferase family protein [Muribaculaceae bacterium]|nr:lysophospholipid acyltransferase family protein [Muribaculaceae bacterium]
MNASNSSPKHGFAFATLVWFLKGVAHLPFGVLYALSNMTFVVLYHIWRYRRRTVDSNLASSFPGLTPRQRAHIRRRFYRNFTDYIFETIKLLHVSDSQMRRRMTFSGVEMADSYLRQGRPVVAFFSHCGNWEWAPSVTLWSELQPGKDVEFCQIYRPLRNKGMDALMLDIRRRFGSVSLPKNRAFLDLMRYRKKEIPTITGFMSDQKPSHGDPGHLVNFLNHPTAFISGTETVARRLDAAVIYWDMRKVSRGHYHIDMKLITDTPGQLPQGAITDRYVSLLTQTIKRDPAIWLWSHNRWKIPVTLPSTHNQ